MACPVMCVMLTSCQPVQRLVTAAINLLLHTQGEALGHFVIGPAGRSVHWCTCRLCTRPDLPQAVPPTGQGATHVTSTGEAGRLCDVNSGVLRHNPRVFDFQCTQCLTAVSRQDPNGDVFTCVSSSDCCRHRQGLSSLSMDS